MKVQVQGGAAVQLTKSNFVAQGGEGAIYVRGDTAFKLYLDPSRMIPEGKFTELSAIDDDNVIRPRQQVLNARGKRVGYTMRFLPDTYALCQLFTRTFREREGIEPQHVVELVKDMRRAVDAIHKAGVLVVDLNEMNVLVSQDFGQSYWIDVDSYQTKSYPATAIMPSVRDWSVQGHDFTEGSDWFSFACVTCNLFLGIHPYKGRYKAIKGMEDRMKAGVSIFHPEVTLPKVCYSMDVIPTAYRDWLKAVLQDGKRLAPPKDLLPIAVAAAVSTRLVTGGVNLDIQELVDLGEQILQVFSLDSGSALVRVADSLIDSSSKARWRFGGTGKMVVGIEPKSGAAVAGNIMPDGKVRLAANGRRLVMVGDQHAQELMGYQGRIYARNEGHVLECKLSQAGNDITVGWASVTMIQPHATRLFQGCAIQNVVGSAFVSLYPRPGTNYQLRVSELEGYRSVVEARLDEHVLMVVARRKDDGYDRLVFRFDEGFNRYDLRTVEDVPLQGLNFVTLDSGVCVCLNEDEKLEVFSERMGSQGLRLIEDPNLGGDMTLVKIGGRVAFFRGSSLYRMQMK